MNPYRNILFIKNRWRVFMIRGRKAIYGGRFLTFTLAKEVRDRLEREHPDMRRRESSEVEGVRE